MESEESAMASAADQATDNTASKSRSCIVCRNRKVRCDKQSPCSNCRRANIACVFPSADRPPRWVRRLDRLTKDSAQISGPTQPSNRSSVNEAMDRLHNLEQLIKEVRGQLENAKAPTGPSDGTSYKASISEPHGFDHYSTQDDASSPREVGSEGRSPFGRLVVQDGASDSHYVGNGFWSRIVDELQGLRIDTAGLSGDASDSDISEDGTEPEPLPTIARGFLFRQTADIAVLELRKLHPLPSQVPFLLDAFSENVNIIIGVIHMPSVRQMARSLSGAGAEALPLSQEALLFATYYAAVASMEEDDTMINFGYPKSDLMARYRLGLEQTLSKADFLVNPDITLVQAFAIFICLARRHDSPRLVYMLTALLVRMATFLGLHRDGLRLGNLTPFDIQMRRRVWWAVATLDTRSAEDQGTELAIPVGSFDTKPPLNVNDADLEPHTPQWPVERQGITDMTFPRIMAGLMEIHRNLMTRTEKTGLADLEERSQIVNGIFQHFEQNYLQYTTEAGNIIHWVSVVCARLVMGKLLLISFLPILFDEPSENLTDEIRHKLLRAAIEVAEYNHALNSETQCRHLRWQFQVHTHWYSVVYMMLELARRPWSPINERAWVALHSPWLLPAQTSKEKNKRIWVPLRKLMAKIRGHRNAEIARLRYDPQAAAQLDAEEAKIEPPSSSGPVPPGSDSVQLFRTRWRQLITPGQNHIYDTINAADASSMYTAEFAHSRPSINTTGAKSAATTAFNPSSSSKPNLYSRPPAPTMTAAHAHPTEPSLTPNPSMNPGTQRLTNPPAHSVAPEGVHWLWADTNTTNTTRTTQHPPTDFSSIPNLDEYVDAGMETDVGGDVNWYQFIESAQGLETEGWPDVGGSGWTNI